MFKEQIDLRLGNLIEQGERLFNDFGFKKEDASEAKSDSILFLNASAKEYVDREDTPTYQSWLSSSCNLISILAPKESYYHTEMKELLTNKKKGNLISSRMVGRVLGLLKSVKDEFSQGLLKDVEYIIAAGTFDNFLDHAASYHKSNKKIESSMLVSVVFEDAMRKVAEKNNLKGRSVEARIDELVKKGVLTPVKAKRMKAYAGIRNDTLHARWEGFDIRDVGEMIGGVRELIETYL